MISLISLQGTGVPVTRADVLHVLGASPTSEPVVVNVGDMVVSQDPSDVLVTYSLGSCLGVAVYDPLARVGGLIHCKLPLSCNHPVKAAQNPCIFVDTGMTVFLNALFARGLRRNRAVVSVAGAAQNARLKESFPIGKNNCVVLRKILWKNEILISAGDLGGTGSRNLWLNMANGKVVVSSQGGQEPGPGSAAPFSIVVESPSRWAGTDGVGVSGSRRGYGIQCPDRG
jgi:chemotaxis protein CheD